MTLEERYWRGERRKRDACVVIQGNAVRIFYAPTVYLDGSMSGQAKQSLTQQQKHEATERFARAIERAWTCDDIPLHDLRISVHTVVTPRMTSRRRGACVRLRFVPPAKAMAIVFRSVFWGLCNRHIMRLHAPSLAWMESAAQHEFLHIMGVFDAYNYALGQRGLWSRLGGLLFPGLAPEEAVGLHRDDMAYSNIYGAGQVVSPLDVEMALCAWRTNRLQTFTHKGLLPRRNVSSAIRKP